MSLKKTIATQGMKLMSDPRVLKMMQDERFMKLMMAAMAVPGRVQTFTDEQKEGFAKTMGVAQEREVKDLQRTVRTLEGEIAELKKKLAAR
jgi:cell division FtsZ-interacting protein ZapD